MDDPEAPVVDDGEVGAGPVEQRWNVEERDGDGRIEEERGQLPLASVLHGRAEGPEHEEEPEDEAHGQQQLPETAQVEVLAALVAQPEPQAAQVAVDARELPEEAAEDHDGQGAEEQEHAGLLALGLDPAHERRQEETPAHPGRGDPEDRQLEVPGPREVVRQDACEVEAVEAPGFDAVVRQGAAQGRLAQEQQRHHREEEAHGLLAGREGPGVEPPLFRVPPARLAAPAQVVELPEDEEDEAQAAQQRDEAHGAPQVGGGRGGVAHQGLVGPAVGVGVGLPRARRHRGPGGPGEVGREVPQLTFVLDELRGQAHGGLVAGEVGLPLRNLGAVGRRLHIREAQGVRPRVIAVLLGLRGQQGTDLQGLPLAKILESPAIPGLGQDITTNLRLAVEVLGGVVGPQVGAVAPEGAVLHEAVLEEDLLAVLDVLTREEHLAGLPHDPGRDGRRACVGLGRDPDQQAEAEDHHEDDGLPPAGGEGRGILVGTAHGAHLLDGLRKTHQTVRPNESMLKQNSDPGV